MSFDKNSFVAEEFTRVLNKLKEKLSKAKEDDYEDDQDMDLQDHGLSDEDMEGMRVADDPLDEEDDADKWLAENDPSAAQEQAGGTESEAGPEAQEEKESVAAAPQKKGKGSFVEWKPHGQYSDEQKAKIKDLMDQGYSEREAELQSARPPGRPTSFQDALKHNVFPSEYSEKHLGNIKPIMEHWLQNKERMDKLEADPEKNPMKHASGQMIRAHEASTQDYANALHQFMNSDKVKNLSGRDRHNAVREWKNQWKAANPDYHEKLAGASEAQKHFGQAEDTKRTNIADRLQRIMGAGAMPSEMSAEEGAQHVGGIKTEHGTQVSTVQDPIAALGASNPKMREQAMSRAKELIGKHGSPEQQERFGRVSSAKTVLRKPGGGQT